MLYLITFREHITFRIVIERTFFLCDSRLQVHLFELETRQLLGSLEQHEDYVHGVAINRAESELYSAGEDGAVKLWDLRSNKTVCSVDVKKWDKLRWINFI